MFELIGRARALNLDFNSLKLDVVSGVGYNTLLNRILSGVLIVAAAIAVFYLIYGGLTYITAGGDAEKATKGRTVLVNAIIGIVIIALAYLIVVWVNSIIKSGNVQ